MLETKAALPAVLHAGSIDSYIQRISCIPLLTAEEEYTLANRLKKEQDLQAARQLILSQLRFVVHVARGYVNYGLSLADLIQEGNVGLMKAVKRFDPDKGVRLISFAVHWIKAEIHDFVLRNWRVVKIATTKDQRKLFFKLRSEKKQLEWMNNAQKEAIAKKLGVKSKTVGEMEMRLQDRDVSYDSPASSGEESYGPADYLSKEDSDPALLIEQADSALYNSRRLRTALQQLDARTRDIISSRWLSEGKSTLQELSGKYAVSAERIRQIESLALKRLRKEMLA